MAQAFKQQEYIFKVILVGDQAVGKSTILKQFINKNFQQDYDVTIGVEFSSKNIQIEKDGPFVQLQIWDTAGQEQYKSLVRTFYRNAAAVVLIYNIARRDSFQALDLWFKEVREHSYHDIIAILVGNQADRAEMRQITQDEGNNWMMSRGCRRFFETSAKTGDNIDKMFQEMARLVHEKFCTDVNFRRYISEQSNRLTHKDILSRDLRMSTLNDGQSVQDGNESDVRTKSMGNVGQQQSNSRASGASKKSCC